jgi:hypothetical protein
VTDQEINRAVAESLGWTDVHMYEDDAGPPIHCGYAPNSTYASLVPDYCNSYDAIMPLVKALKKGREQRFVEKLTHMVYPDEGNKDWVLIHISSCHALITATPRQLCEAYLAVGGVDA